MTKTYTGEEVQQHNTENDLWMVMNGNVYDLTKFLREHPGGEEVLINLAGQDGTKCFDEIGHTSEAIQLRETFKIGNLSGTITGSTSATSATEKNTTVDDDDWTYEEIKVENSPWLPIILTFGGVIYGCIFYYLWYS